MAILDADSATDLRLVEDDGGIGSTPTIRPEHEPRDWQSLYEQAHVRAERERDRADAAEARCEELRWAEVDSRARANSFKTYLDKSRAKLKAAIEETKELRRAAKDVPPLKAEVAHLRKLLSEATEPSEDDTTMLLSDEVARLRKALAASQARKGTGRRRVGVVDRSPGQMHTIRSLRKENTRLKKEVVRCDKGIARLHTRLDQEKERSESLRETGKMLSRENLSLHREARFLKDAEARARSLSDEVYWLRYALDASKAGKEKLKARIAKLRAAGATLSKLPFDEAAQLRTVLRRSRRQKTAIGRLRKENARLRRAVKAAKAGRPAGGGGPCCRASHGQEDTVDVAVGHRRRVASDSAPIASPEGDDQGTVPGERPSAQVREGIAGPDRGAGSPACQAALERVCDVEEALRAQERAAEEAALWAQSRPAARRARPRPHPEARA